MREEGRKEGEREGRRGGRVRVREGEEGKKREICDVYTHHQNCTCTYTLTPVVIDQQVASWTVAIVAFSEVIIAQCIGSTWTASTVHFIYRNTYNTKA